MNKIKFYSPLIKHQVGLCYDDITADYSPPFGTISYSRGL